MINSKKVLSVITTVMSCWGMAPCHICAMDSEEEENKMMYYVSPEFYSIINQTNISGDETRDNTITNQLATNNPTLQRRNAAEIPLNVPEKNSIEENFDVLDYYKGKTFFDSVFDILQDIAECVHIYRIKETGHYVYVYECNVLEPTCEQNSHPCLSNHCFTDLNKGLKETFYRLLKHMLKKLIESSSRNILLHNQKKRVYLSDYDKKKVEEFLNNNLEKSEFKTVKSEINFIQYFQKVKSQNICEYVDKCVNDQLRAWEGKFKVDSVQSMEKMKEILDEFYPCR